MNFIDDPRKSKKLSNWLIKIVVICVVIYLALRYIDVVGRAVGFLTDLFSPIIAGIILALILNVAMRPIERHLFPNAMNPKLIKLRRPLSIVISIVAVTGIFIFVVCLIVPELIQALAVIGEGLVQLADSLTEWSSETQLSDTMFGSLMSMLGLDFTTLQDKVVELVRDSGPKVMTSAANAISGIGSSVFNFILGLVFSIYILYDKENLKKQAKRLVRAWIPQRGADVVIHVADVSNVTFRSFVAGQTTEAVILGTLCMVGMLILRLPYAPMIGALVGVTALIPIFGALIGTLVGAIMIVSVDPFKALVFVIFLLILQQVEGDVIYPRVVGSKIGLPGMWVLAAVTVGGSLGGAIGMLLGVPVFSVLYTLINEATDRRVPESGIEEGAMEKDMGKDMENGNSDEKTESLVPEAVGGGSGADGKNG